MTGGNGESVDILLDRTIQTMRRISTELRPGILDDLGLGAAIDWQAQEFQHRTGIKTRCSANVDDFVDRDRSTAVFRIFQEALTNIARHAKATHVNVELYKETNLLHLVVRDNGKGITEHEITDSRSLGILGMRERAQLLCGDVEITGKSNEGSTVRVTIPVADA